MSDPLTIPITINIRQTRRAFEKTGVFFIGSYANATGVRTGGGAARSKLESIHFILPNGEELEDGIDYFFYSVDCDS